MQRFLILGAAGLIGRTLVKRLHAAGHELFLVDIREGKDEERLTWIKANALERTTIVKLIDKVQPQGVINCINLATIFSEDPKKGYKGIIDFYLNLYRGLVNLQKPVHYVQMGTTGSGGLGLNIPFTHGGKLEDLPIINKAAFSGITTSMLTLLSRSFPSGMVRVSEVKPGLAIFAEGIVEREHSGARMVTLDGGESGHYTYNETALLTQYMGYTSVERIADKVQIVLQGLQTERTISEFDVIEALNDTIIAPHSDDVLRRQELMQEMIGLQGDTYIIATGNLGPPSITRDLIFSHLYANHDFAQDDTAFRSLLKNDASVVATLAYIHEKHPDLFRYLEEECTFRHYKQVHDFYLAGSEPWQTAAASLSKNPHITKVE